MRPRLDRSLLALLLLTLGACGGSSGAVSPSGTPPTTGPTAAPPAPAPVPAPPAPEPIPEPVPEPTPAPAPPSTEVLSVLALYTPGVRALYADPLLRIEHVLELANAVSADSGAPLEATLAHTAEVPYADGQAADVTLEALTFATDPAFADVAALRETHAADLVVLFQPYANDGLCGYAWVGGQGNPGDFSHPAEPDFAFSVVAANCSDYTLLHELGHNLGLVHSRREDPDGGSLPHGAGHGVDNDFVTIMASAPAFNAVKLPLLSNPARLCHGEPCGVSREDPALGADAVHALEASRDQVAAYR